MPAHSPRRTIEYWPGTPILKRYRIIHRLGNGANAIVYLAHDAFMNEQVALKFALAEPGPVELEQLRSEVRIGRTIRHPNVCSIFHLDRTDDAITFVSMEYVDGEDLKTLLGRSLPFSRDRAITLAVQLFAGVENLHLHGAVHRDIKPANVMIDGHGNVKITDLGLAVFADMARKEIAGTPHYMAPEQIIGNPARPPIDVYAIGLILYEAFTGARCLSGNSFREILDSQNDMDRRRPCTVAPALDPSIDHLIMLCLDKLPEKRPTASQLRQQWEMLRE